MASGSSSKQTHTTHNTCMHVLARTHKEKRRCSPLLEEREEGERSKAGDSSGRRRVFFEGRETRKRVYHLGFFLQNRNEKRKRGERGLTRRRRRGRGRLAGSRPEFFENEREKKSKRRRGGRGRSWKRKKEMKRGGIYRGRSEEGVG